MVGPRQWIVLDRSVLQGPVPRVVITTIAEYMFRRVKQLQGMYRIVSIGDPTITFGWAGLGWAGL